MSTEFRKYFKVFEEFNWLLSYAESLVNSLVGLEPSNSNEVYGERIFVKLLCHGITLKRISPSPIARTDKELWDISSSYAVSRALIETFDALSYIALAAIDNNEKEFRLIFWKLHAEARRLDMLTKISSKDPRLEETRNLVEDLRNELFSHPYFVKCASTLQTEVRKGKYQPYHLSQKERNEEAGINHIFRDVVTMHLSSHVHTHPFSVFQISEFRAGTDECIGLMSVSIQYAASFLSKAIEGMIKIFPEIAPNMHNNLHAAYNQWKGIAEHGI